MNKIIRTIKPVVKSAYINLVKMPYLAMTQVYYGMAGHKVECNICHHKSDKFYNDVWHKYCTCPSCGTGLRQRLLLAALAHSTDFRMAKMI